MSQARPTSADQPSTLMGFDRDELAYIAPMASFLLIMSLGFLGDTAYALAYVARTIVAALLLHLFWRRYTTIGWSYAWLGAIMGVLGVVQWIGMDSLLQIAWPKLFALKPEKAFDPTTYFDSALSMWAWIAVRIFGSSLVVPFMEELFWRDYLWRRLIAPADFKLAKVGEWDKVAFFGVAVAFCVVHPQWLTAVGWGLMVGGLLLYTRSLGACIVMHAVTNFLLAIYVLRYQAWEWW